MRTAILALAATTILGATTPSLAAGKPDPTPNWRCRIAIVDATDDNGYKITNDGLGDYVDGVGGVTCYVINEPGTVQDRWLFMSITGTQRKPPTRVVNFIGQGVQGSGPWYDSFYNHGTFEVMGLGKVGYPVGEVLPFRAYLRGPDVELKFKDGYATVAGDSNLIGSLTVDPDDHTSSVFVQPLDPLVTPCSWDVISYTTGPRLGTEQDDTQISPRVMRITEGKFDLTHSAVLRGDFPMPFAATVTLTPNASGCPQ